MDHFPALQRDRPIRERQGKIEMMIDDNDRYFMAQAIKGFKQLLDHRRRKTFKGLVKKKDADVAGQGAL